MLVERTEDRAGVAVVVAGKVGGVGVDGEGAERSGEAGELLEELFGVGVLGGVEVAERGRGAVEGVEEPVVGDVEG